MILFQNGLITLNYDPATDILFIQWPDFHTVSLPEIKAGLRKLIENIRNYDVKKLLIDSSKTIVAISEQEHTEIMLFFIQEIAKTRLQKVARIKTNDKFREDKAIALQDKSQFPIPFRNFATRAEAEQWLLENIKTK